MLPERCFGCSSHKRPRDTQPNSPPRTVAVDEAHARGLTTNIALARCLESRAATVAPVMATSTQLATAELRLFLRYWAVLRLSAGISRSSPILSRLSSAEPVRHSRSAAT